MSSPKRSGSAMISAGSKIRWRFWIVMVVGSIFAIFAIDVCLESYKYELVPGADIYDKRSRLKTLENNQSDSDRGLASSGTDVAAADIEKESDMSDVSLELISSTAAPALPQEVKNETIQSKEESHYHDYAIFIVHYHKTGFVLSRELRKLVAELELGIQRPNQTLKIFKPSKHFNFGIDPSLNERIAFDHLGNWARSAFQSRHHHPETQCPKNFQLKNATIYVQESPDLYCSDENLLQFLNVNSNRGGTKIIHFVRNPFEMVLSNYFYHSQDPTPETWVYDHDPCDHVCKSGKSLAKHVLTTLSSKMGGGAPSSNITQDMFEDVLGTCKSLYQSKRKMKNAMFYDHLRELNTWDGLQLAASQMILSCGNLAGGDILRMANNIVRFNQLLSSSSENQKEGGKIELLTVSMGEFIDNAAESTLKFLDFIFGSDNDVITNDMKLKASKAQEDKYETKQQKNKNHVTQTESVEDKDILRAQLRSSPTLGPLLNETERLVNNALLQYGF